MSIIGNYEKKVINQDNDHEMIEIEMGLSLSLSLSPTKGKYIMTKEMLHKTTTKTKILYG